jgi:hypothetical protein
VAEAIGYGTILEVDTGGGFVEIARLTEIGEIDLGEPDDVEITGYDSPDGFKEFIPGLEDGGTLDFTGVYTGVSSQTSLAALRRSVADWRLTLPDALGQVTFEGYLKGPKLNAPLSDKAEFSGSIKITGKPTLTVSVSTGLTTPFFSMSESAVIAPAPSGSVYEYVATVLTGVTSVTITPTATAGVIKVNGNVVATGVASSAIALGGALSVTTATITVTETNKQAKTYTIYIRRA